MASKFCVSLTLLFLLLCQTLNGLEIITNNQNNKSRFRGFSCRDCCLEALKSSSENITVTTVGVDKIADAIRASGYGQTLPTILERTLQSVMSTYCDDFLFFVDRKNRFTLYGENSTITLFVPPDDKIRFDGWIDLDYQILTAKIDEEAFSSGSLSEGSVFVSLGWFKQRLVVDRVFDDGTVSINGVKVTKWNIYNDGRIIVHGTEDFFNESDGESGIMRDPYYDPLDIKSRMEIYEDPQDGSYKTTKMFFKAEDYPEEIYPWPLSSIRVLL